jgi:hypothetical protein
MFGEEVPPAKRRRQCDEHATSRRKHLYLALDDWQNGCSIYKLDADDMEPSGRLPGPAALRIAGALRGGIAFAAIGGTSIIIDTTSGAGVDRAPTTLVYSTETGALALGPRVPDELHDLSGSMAAGGKLYAVTFQSVQVLSWEPADDEGPRDPPTHGSWTSLVPTTPPIDASEVVAYALHPDGRTIFMSSTVRTFALDTGGGAWRELGNWVLPFRGQGHYDGYLDAWVGLHRGENGHVCCCLVASRSAAAARGPECKVLREKLFRNKDEVKPGHRHLKPTLTYMGDGRFCLVENVMRGECYHEGSVSAVLHVTLFGLQYDHKGELQTKIRRSARSYEVSKNTLLFSHAAFWM